MELPAEFIIKTLEDMEDRIDQKTEELFPSKGFKRFFTRHRGQKDFIP